MGSRRRTDQEEVVVGSKQVIQLNRRRFLGGLTAMGTAGLLGLQAKPVAAEPPPETTRIRLVKYTSACQAPLYLSEELLRTEGFTDVQWVSSNLDVSKHLATGTVDLGMNFVGPNLIGLDSGDPAVMLAGGHVGCWELVGTERVRRFATSRGRPSP